MTRRMRYKKVKKTSDKNKKTLISVLSLVLIFTTVVAITLAYQTDTTQEIVNEFETPTIVTPIEEEFDGVTKTNVTATNSEDSDVDVYVRLKFVVQTLEAVLDSEGNPVMQDETGVDVYLIYNEDGTLLGYSLLDDGTVDADLSYDTLTYKTGDIVATPSSFGEDGYLLNTPINILNVFDVAGLNVAGLDSSSEDGYADWFTDANQETGIYYYKYSLAPGESAYDLVTNIEQEIFYENTIVRLTVLVDSVQVDGVEDAWGVVNQSGNSEDADPDAVVVAYTDANGNPIIYAAGVTGAAPTESVSADFVQRFSDNYDATKGLKSDGSSLIADTVLDTTE